MNDATVGRAMRALRRRKGWRQEDLAAAAKVSQAVVSRAERGHVAGLSLAATRSLFAALDAGCSVSVWWRSGELDRLLDEDHAALVARAVAFLGRHGWSAQVEATFQFDRETGSIDILATRRADGVALVVEVKTRLMSVEELLRTLDRKVRVAAQVVLQREGWRPTFVGRLVVSRMTARTGGASPGRPCSRRRFRGAATRSRRGCAHPAARRPASCFCQPVNRRFVSAALSGRSASDGRSHARKRPSQRAREPARPRINLVKTERGRNRLTWRIRLA